MIGDSLLEHSMMEDVGEESFAVLVVEVEYWVEKMILADSQGVSFDSYSVVLVAVVVLVGDAMLVDTAYFVVVVLLVVVEQQQILEDLKLVAQPQDLFVQKPVVVGYLNETN